MKGENEGCHLLNVGTSKSYSTRAALKLCPYGSRSPEHAKEPRKKKAKRKKKKKVQKRRKKRGNGRRRNELLCLHYFGGFEKYISLFASTSKGRKGASQLGIYAHKVCCFSHVDRRFFSTATASKRASETISAGVFHFSNNLEYDSLEGFIPWLDGSSSLYSSCGLDCGPTCS